MPEHPLDNLPREGPRERRRGKTAADIEDLARQRFGRPNGAHPIGERVAPSDRVMPIRPETRRRYPKGWKAISECIRFGRAKNRCECRGECGDNYDGRCQANNYEPHPITGSRVVLTVAHLDHTPENCEDGNLRAMCQRCHNRYDAPTRQRNRKARLAGGIQLELWGPA